MRGGKPTTGRSEHVALLAVRGAFDLPVEDARDTGWVGRDDGQTNDGHDEHDQVRLRLGGGVVSSQWAGWVRFGKHHVGLNGEAEKRHEQGDGKAGPTRETPGRDYGEGG